MMATTHDDLDVRSADRLGAWTGLAFTAAFLGWIAYVLQVPPMSEPAARAGEWLAENAGLLRTATFVFWIVVLVLLLPFTAALGVRLERADAMQQVLARVMLLGVAVSVVMLAMDSFGGAVLAQEGRIAEIGPAELERAWDEARTFVLLGFHLATGLWIAAASLGLLRTRIAPRWVGWLGLALLVPHVVAASWMVGGEVTVFHDSLAGVAITGSFLVWLPAVSLALLRGSRTVDTARTAPDVSATR